MLPMLLEQSYNMILYALVNLGCYARLAVPKIKISPKLQAILFVGLQKLLLHFILLYS
jgi:hypothetical protein